METTGDGFQFRRLSGNPAAVAKRSNTAWAVQNSEPTEKPHKKKSRTSKPYEATRAESKNTVDDELFLDGFAIRRMSHNKPAAPPSKQHRETIRMNDSIDISTASSHVDLQDPTEEAQPDNDNDSTIIMHYPVMEEKIKSYEIHKRVLEPNVNKLIVECIKFLNCTSAYATEVRRHCLNNYFSDINYKNEIEAADGRMSVIGTEIRKWNEIYARKIKAARTLPEPIDISGIQRSNINMQDIRSEFEEKARCLKVKRERVRCFLESMKTHSELLLKGIFTAAEEKSVNPLFLLRAMSKLVEESESRIAVE